MRKTIAVLVLSSFICILGFTESIFLEDHRRSVERNLRGLLFMAVGVVTTTVSILGAWRSAESPTDDGIGWIALAGVGGGVLSWGMWAAYDSDSEIRRLEFAMENESSFTDLELVLIDAELVDVGMSESALLASKGRPESINTTLFEDHIRKQYVYGDGGPYVYVDNGVVTAVQQ